MTGFNFSRRSKASLGVNFLSLIETGRFTYWSGEDQPLADGWWFFTQAHACAYSLPPDGVMERDLRWGVPEGARVDTTAGSQLVHDDRLISAALVAVYDDLWREGQLHLGQAAGAGAIQLEAIAVNVGSDETNGEAFELESGCPVAYRSPLPLADWSQQIRSAGIPCHVSHHAGTYLCNAIFYWTSMYIERHGWDTQVAFIHVPLASEQVASMPGSQPSLPVALSATAIRTILNQL